MFTVDGIRKFHFWTHDCLSLVLDHLSTIPASDYIKEVPGFGIPKLREQVIHIFNCEGFWIHAIQGLDSSTGNQPTTPPLPMPDSCKREVSEQTLAYLSGLTNRTTEQQYGASFSRRRLVQFALPRSSFITS